MANVWTGSLNFALMSIPIAVSKAAQERDGQYKMNQVVAKTVENGVVTEFAAVGRKEYVKGAPEGKDNPAEYGGTMSAYFPDPNDMSIGCVVTEEELQAIRPESSKTLMAECFIDMAKIPVWQYTGAHYWITPKGNQAHYDLMVAVLRAHKKIAGNKAPQKRAMVAKWTYRNRERTVIIHEQGYRLMMHELYANSEIRELEETCYETAVDPTLFSLLDQLVEKKMDPDASVLDNIVDKYEVNLKALIDSKLNGEPIKIETKKANDIPNDLRALLEASLAQLAPPVEEKKTKTKKASK